MMPVKVNNLKGEYGFLVISDTSAHLGPFDIVDIMADSTQFASGTVVNGTGLATLTFQRGESIGGTFSSITLTSGSVIAYYSKPQ